MARRKPKTRIKARQKLEPNNSSTYAAIGTISVAAVVCLLAFLSMELAFLAVGYLGITAFLILDHRRRQHWEQANSFKIRVMGENHDQLVREVSRNRSDIMGLKETIANTANKLDEQEKQLRNDQFEEKQELKKMASDMRLTAKKVRSRANAQSFDQLAKLEVMPRAFKARKLSTIKKKVSANDDMSVNYNDFSDTVVTELLHNALRNERVEVFMQPIMRLPQRKIRAYEVFGRVRARPGVYIPAARYMNIAEKEDMMENLDHLLLMNCLHTIQQSAHIQNATPFFVNITSQTLGNGRYMKDLLGFLAKNRPLAKRLVLEIRQDDFENMHPAILEILRGLTALGCSLSLDHVNNFNFDIRFLNMVKIRYIKITAQKFIRMTARPDSLRMIYKAKRQLEGNGIALILERVEHENTLKELLDYDIHYGQGHLFGRAELQGVYRQRAAA